MKKLSSKFILILLVFISCFILNAQKKKNEKSTPKLNSKKNVVVKKKKASKASSQVKEESKEVIITSELLDYDYQKKMAIFRKNVKAIDGEVIMTAEKMTCYFNDDNTIKLIIAEEDVNIQKGLQVAVSGRAVYNVEKHEVRMTKSPVLDDGEVHIVCRSLLMYLDIPKRTFFEDPEVDFLLKKKKKKKKKSDIKKD